MNSDHCLLQTTVGTEADAHRLAEHAVQSHLAACVHIEPIASVYRWQGQIQHEREWRLGFKTTHDKVAALVQALRSVHPYELPAFYTLNATPATPEWAHWVQEACGG